MSHSNRPFSLDEQVRARLCLNWQLCLRVNVHCMFLWCIQAPADYFGEQQKELLVKILERCSTSKQIVDALATLVTTHVPDAKTLAEDVSIKGKHVILPGHTQLKSIAHWSQIGVSNNSSRSWTRWQDRGLECCILPTFSRSQRPYQNRNDPIRKMALHPVLSETLHQDLQ